jgi:hypothetical protein
MKQHMRRLITSLIGWAGMEGSFCWGLMAAQGWPTIRRVWLGVCELYRAWKSASRVTERLAHSDFTQRHWQSSPPAYFTMGDKAIEVSPRRKKQNIRLSRKFTRAVAPSNSFQMKTPQRAEIIVFPSPIANEVAGPIRGT